MRYGVTFSRLHRLTDLYEIGRDSLHFEEGHLTLISARGRSRGKKLEVTQIKQQT